jgi:hypothetical protein
MLQAETMLKTTTSGRGGLYVKAAADLGAIRHGVSTVQHHDPDFLLHRKVVRLFGRPAPLSVV